MRFLLASSILVSLLGCSAAPLPVPDGAAKSGDDCAFGEGMFTITDSPFFDLEQVGSFDGDTHPSPSELSAILEYMPPSVDTIEKVLAFVDDGWIEKYAIVDRASGAQLYDMYTYNRDGATSGFITSIQTGEFASFIKDGAFDDCRVRADEVGLASECIFGKTYEEYASGPFEFSVFEDIDADTTLSDLEFRQIQAGLPLFGNTIEEVFEDIAYLQVETATSTRDRQVFTVYYYGLPSGDQGGFYYRKGTTQRVAVLIGDKIEQCTVSVQTAPEPSSCLFGDIAEDLIRGQVEGRFTYEEVGYLSPDSELTELQERQLRTLVPGAGGSLDYLFSRSDDGKIEVGILVSENTNHNPFTMYTYEDGAELSGALFTRGSVDRVAVLSGSDITECTVDAP